MGTVKKICSIIWRIFTWVLVAFTVCVVVLTAVSLGKGERSILGYSFYIVRSDSMSPSENNADMKVHFSAGDIVISKNLKEEDKYTLQPGQIVTFISMNKSNYGDNVTHVIRSVEKDENGRTKWYVTYGSNTGDDDETPVSPSHVVGVYAGQLPKFGDFFAFVKSTRGYVFCILIPCLLLCIYNGVRVFVLLKRYRKEQAEVLEAEKAEIARQKKQNEDMFRELQALKDELLKQSGSAEASEKPSAENATEPAVVTEVAEENNGTDDKTAEGETSDTK